MATTLDNSSQRRRHISLSEEDEQDSTSSTISTSTSTPERSRSYQETTNNGCFLSVLRYVFGFTPVLSPKEQCCHFITRLKTQYDQINVKNATTTTTENAIRNQNQKSLPPILEMSYREAVAMTSKKSKFLLVILISEEHQTATEFYQNVLFREEFCNYLRDHSSILCWSTSVLSSDGLAVAYSLGAATFPYMALLACITKGVTVVEKIYGIQFNNMCVSYIQQKLNKAVHNFKYILDSAKEEERERRERQNLLEEQNLEYQRSLEADRLKAQEENERKEMEMRTQEEKMIQDYEKIKEELRKKQEEEKYYASLVMPEEPELNEDQATLIRFQLPNGQRLQRRFKYSHTFKDLHNFIDIKLYEQKTIIKNYELATNYPRRAWGPDTLDITLEEAEITSQTVLYVQDLDT